ncbi:LPS export ABC transporter permease LptG [Marinobacter bryozoorum]|uniref:LPS export ABC transporter permease LptG n=1 Tax=Marinobacter bryozoorum TaxID=256324 RepID=UPI00249E3EA6|nr:LPS export ABC transporter permease LptG [Marinobacter bryozoorum]
MGNVGGAIFLVMMVVLSLDVVFGYIAELEDVRADYQALEAALFMLLTLPRRIYDYLPLGAFMGCLVGLGAMASSSELTVIRAAGVSIRRIVWSSMKPALVVVLIGLVIGEYVAPPAERLAQSQKAVARGGDGNIANAEGVWHREGDTFIHLNAVTPDGNLQGVALFRMDDDRWLASASFARTATFQGDHWLLQDIRRTRISREGTEREVSTEERWESGLTPDVLSVLVVKPENLPLTGLYTYARYLDQQGLTSAQYWLAFWKKVLMPVGTAVMVIVAISFIFGPLRSVTMGFRVFTGLIVGLLFKYMQDLLGPMSVVFGFNPVLAILVPIVINGLIGAWLMRRAG